VTSGSWVVEVREGVGEKTRRAGRMPEASGVDRWAENGAVKPAGGEARLPATADEEPLKSEEKEGILSVCLVFFWAFFLLGRTRKWSTLISIKDQNLYMRISPLKTDFFCCCLFTFMFPTAKENRNKNKKGIAREKPN